MLHLFQGKKIFLTGHTGFKGAWLLQLLHHLGANVKGYALAPENDDDLYHQVNGDQLCYASVTGNILDAHLLQGEIIRFEPDFVFHLAAQSLVRRSYRQPADTFAVNTMGTVNVLEAMRALEKPCVGLMVTTDKVYENRETGAAFKEDEKLGGHDPYSASKAAAEIAIASYRNSFFPPAAYDSHLKSIASVRAGNVIGGGDYASDRIIPDIVRAVERGEKVTLRHPKAIRPWQHVLEPLVAYLALAAKMYEHPGQGAEAYNIGPDQEDVLDVETVTRMFIGYYGSGRYEIAPHPAPLHEAQTLLLDNTKIKRALGWQPRLNAAQALQWTAAWYADKDHTASEKTLQQISDYIALQDLY